MDTIKVLLGITVALLLGALAMSWKNFQHEQGNEPKEKLAEIQRQITEIRQEQERLRQERDRIAFGTTATPPSPAPAPAMPEAPATTPELPAPAIPETPATVVPETAPEPAGLSADAVAQRAKAIESAAVVAKVTEWVDDPQIGSFGTLQVMNPASVQAGTVLCVRRNSGILGRLKVSEITPEGAIANPLSQFGPAKPVAGDELILEPVIK